MSEVTDKYKEITGYNIEKFFNDYIYFSNNYYSSIVNYYSGLNIDQDAFNYLDTLKKESDKITGLWELFSNRFELTSFWDLLDTFDNIKIKLNTVDSLNRWLRSSRTNQYSQNTKTTYVQRQGESLEKVVSKFGSFDKENDWVKLSLQNNIKEEDYTSQGGKILTINLSNNFNFDISNIVDGLTKENLYGKDIKKKIEILDGDIATLYGEESLLQTIDTIFSTNKGSIIEFPEDGFDSNLIGSNTNVFNYTSLFRNLMNMLQKDDRFQTIELIDINKQDDYVSMQIQLKTKLGNLFQQSIVL